MKLVTEPCSRCCHQPAQGVVNEIGHPTLLALLSSSSPRRGDEIGHPTLLALLSSSSLGRGDEMDHFNL
jgi:hypothetical protein